MIIHCWAHPLDISGQARHPIRNGQIAEYALPLGAVCMVAERCITGSSSRAWLRLPAQGSGRRRRPAGPGSRALSAYGREHGRCRRAPRTGGRRWELIPVLDRSAAGVPAASLRAFGFGLGEDGHFGPVKVTHAGRVVTPLSASMTGERSPLDHSDEVASADDLRASRQDRDRLVGSGTTVALSLPQNALSLPQNALS